MSKVLITDDEPGMRQVISKVLSPYFDTVITAEDGATAIDLAKKESPDLVMLDIRLPDMDGLDILQEIKTFKPDTPVIMLSGFGDVDTAVELVRRGAFDYMSKPFKVDRLLELVKAALEQNGVKPRQPIGGDAPAPAEAQKSKTEEKTQKEPAKPQEKPKPAASQGSPVIEIKNTWIFAGLGAVLLIAGGLLAYKFMGGRPETKEFAISYSNPSSLFSDGKSLWVNDWMEETTYHHKLDEKLSVESYYKLAGLQVSGIAFDGKNFWSCSSAEKKITKHTLDANLTIAASYPAPGISVSGLYFDGQVMWSMDFQQGKIYKHDMNNNMSVADTFESFATNPCGMFKKGNNFYIGDSSTNMIYKVSAKDFSIEAVYILPGFQDKKNRLAGLAFDGKYIYTCADGVSKIVRHSMNSLKPLGK